MENTEIEEAALKIMRADWYYGRSDDYGAYNRGLASVNAVTTMVKSKDWTIDEVEMIRKECHNRLQKNYVDQDIPNNVLEFWNDTVNSVFKKVLENE